MCTESDSSKLGVNTNNKGVDADKSDDPNDKSLSDIVHGTSQKRKPEKGNSLHMVLKYSHCIKGEKLSAQ